MRLTSQLTPRNKVSFYYDYQWDCDQGGMNKTDGCRPRGDDWVPGTVFGNAFSAEANTNYWDAREIISQVTWSSPVTNKLLLEAGYATFVSHWGWMKQPGAITNLVQMTSARAVPRVPGRRQHHRQHAEPEHVARVGDLRHGRAQPEGRLSRRVSRRSRRKTTRTTRGTR